MNRKSEQKTDESIIIHIETLLYLILLLLLVGAVSMIFLLQPGMIKGFNNWRKTLIPVVSQARETHFKNDSLSAFWQAPDLKSIQGSGLEQQILYGRELIMHTSRYLGPNGSVASISNGMNCQNCHLEGGTKIFGNNYGSVYATYPRFRARSGSVENIYKRVNDCFERSLNGLALDTMSAEMQAIKAYLIFLGKNVPKGQTAKGSGLKDLPFLERAADPKRGQIAYSTRCSECHQPDGQGILGQDKKEYVYPPLWGEHSYNDAAGLYRLSNFAKYIKTNMPVGATHQSPVITDEEAWDIAAFVNSMPRPHKDVPDDWPDISKKPVDHPYGPYADTFSVVQHKFGPFGQMKRNVR